MEKRLNGGVAEFTLSLPKGFARNDIHSFLHLQTDSLELNKAAVEITINHEIQAKNTPVAILGFGVEGAAVCEFLQKHGFKNITVTDRDKTIKSIPKKIKKRLGHNYLEKLSDFKIVFRSPGIPYLSKEIQAAKKQHTIITSATALVFENCRGKIVGVTGTKGKGTTATLLYKMLKNDRKKVFLAGNIGQPALSLLEKIGPKSILILELSSFQLQDLKQSPQIAIVLNTTSEHLDHHRSNAEYLKAKEPIVAYQSEEDIAIVNRDYPGSVQYAEKTPADILTVSTKKALEEGAYVKNGIIYYVDKTTETKPSHPPHVKTLCHTRDIALIGKHNLENILPAVTAANLLKCSRKSILKAVKTFKGLPHRLEYITKRKGITFYNDSFSTIPESTIAAVRAFETPLILIVGGSEKFSDFSDLGQAIVQRRNLKTVVLIGITARRIEQAITDANREATEDIEYYEKTGQTARMLDIKRELPLKVIHADNIHQAFLTLKLNAKKGDTVVLSPACASFDQFENYKHRGETFRQLAREF